MIWNTIIGIVCIAAMYAGVPIVILILNFFGLGITLEESGLVYLILFSVATSLGGLPLFGGNIVGRSVWLILIYALTLAPSFLGFIPGGVGTLLSSYLGPFTFVRDALMAPSLGGISIIWIFLILDGIDILLRVKNLGILSWIVGPIGLVVKIGIIFFVIDPSIFTSASMQEEVTT